MSKKDGTLLIDVPQGGASITTIKLTPKLPKAGQAQVWTMDDVTTEKVEKFSNVVVAFDENSLPDQVRYERAILVVHLSEKAQKQKGYWSFAFDGLQYVPSKEDDLHNIETQVSRDGQVLTLTIHNFGLNSEDVDFSFVAMYRDNQSGECPIYASADPGIRVGRPPGP